MRATAYRVVLELCRCICNVETVDGPMRYLPVVAILFTQVDIALTAVTVTVNIT